MEKRKKMSRVRMTVSIFVMYLFMMSLVLGISYIIVQVTLEQNLKNRAIAELKAKVEMQAAVADNLMEKEYIQLRILDEMLNSSGGDIASRQFRDILEMMEEKEQISILGVADLKGDVLNAYGDVIGNIRDRQYFQDLIHGRKEEACVRLNATIQSNTPELLYAVPLHVEDQLAGVIFKSKRIIDVEETLIDDVHFNGCANLFVVDQEGNIILVGDEADRFLLSDNLFDGCNNFQFQNADGERLKEHLRNGQMGELIFYQKDKLKYGFYMPSGVEGWTIFSTVDKEAAKIQYRESDQVIEKSVFIICILFAVSLLVSIVLLILHVARQKKIRSEYSHQYEGYKRIMSELTYPVFLYDAKIDELTGNAKFKEQFSRERVDGFRAHMKQWKELHPEYNFDGLFMELNKAVQERKIITFESTLQMGEANRWVKSILIPVIDAQGKEWSLFGIVMDTTNEHQQFETAVGMTAYAPVGLYRVNLNTSIHIEYINEGFKRMLGYSREEINQSNVEEMIRERCNDKSGDVREYRLRCKDGSYLMVSDTMDIKYDSDGARYGYGVIVDISKYREAQERSEKKLEKLQIQLNESRIKISAGQMQPHFLYNALASIREIVLENPEYAADLIFDFTTHLRACIKSMGSEEMVSFAQEIENIKAYVNIEKMRFGDKMKVEYDIQEKDFPIVPLSVQPLVENAIRHGIYERGSDGGTVTIRSYRQGDSRIIQVEDDGVGFDVEKIKQEVEEHTRDSAGLQSLIFRFENLMNATVRVESTIGKGTKVTITIPVKGEENNESDDCR